MRDEGGTLRFVTADGRSIPRNGYRLEDFVDETDENPSRERFCTTTGQRAWDRDEVRETTVVYRLKRIASPLGPTRSFDTAAFRDEPLAALR